MTEKEKRAPWQADPVQVTLSCTHDASYKVPIPEPGDEVYCTRCQQFVTVRVQPEVWIRCDRCPLARRHGQDIAAARRLASRHALKNNTHIVTITRGAEVLERVGNELEEGQQPFDTILEERRELSRNLQKMLRPDD